MSFFSVQIILNLRFTVKEAFSIGVGILIYLTSIKSKFLIRRMELSTTTLALIAIIAVLGLIGVVAVDTIEIIRDAEAGGCKNSIAFNTSKGRCFMG